MPRLPQSRLDRLALCCLLFVIIGLGFIVEKRSAFAESRHTDLGVYLRASWEVLHGGDIGEAVDDHGWHYTYPPLFAILLVPFADAPSGVEQYSWTVPYPMTVAVWYLFSWAALFWGIWRLAAALEWRAGSRQRPVSGDDESKTRGADATPLAVRSYWWVRLWPVWLCLPAIGSTLSRGQVNLQVTALMMVFLADVLDGRHGRAGWWLALASCLKVIPALLILDPLVRREWRTVRQYAYGMVVGLVLIPVLALGPQRAYESSKTFVARTLFAGVTSEEGGAGVELTNMNATDNQSIQAILHNLAYPDALTRPAKAAFGVKLSHLLLGVGLIWATFACTRRMEDERYRTLFRVGGLTLLLIPVSPVSHLHYFVFAIPSVLGLVQFERERRGDFLWSAPIAAVLLVQFATSLLPRFPGFERLRDLGLATLGLLVLWLASVTYPMISTESMKFPRLRIAFPNLFATAIRSVQSAMRKRIRS